MKIEATPEELKLIIHALSVAGKKYSEMAGDVAQMAGSRFGRHEAAAGIQNNLHQMACYMADLEVRMCKEIKQ